MLTLVIMLIIINDLIASEMGSGMMIFQLTLGHQRFGLCQNLQRGKIDTQMLLLGVLIGNNWNNFQIGRGRLSDGATGRWKLVMIGLGIIADILFIHDG